MNPVSEAVRGARRAAGRAYRRVRGWVEAVLHPRRHRAALERLQRRERPRRILVVCYGNICRSPYLEAVLRRDVPDVEVSSAGFVGPGRGVPEHSITLSRERRLDLTAHRSRLISPSLARSADLIAVMDARQAEVVQTRFGVPAEAIVIVGDLDPGPIESRAISDPWGRPIEAFRASFIRLDRCAAVLARVLNGVR